MKKQELIDLTKKLATQDALTAQDDFSNLENKEALFSIAEDAWYHSGAIYLQEHESLEEFQDVIDEMNSELNKIYDEQFVDTIIDKYSLKFA